MNNSGGILSSRRRISAFSVLLIMTALAIIGLAMLPMLNIQYTPMATERRIDVSFSWSNASARLIEQNVTSRIEAALSTIADCESVSSRSSKDFGSVSIWFRKGVNMTAVRYEVASVLRNLHAKLPPQVSYPNISLASTGGREVEVLIYTIKADLPSERIDKYVTDYVSTHLAKIDGVGRISLSGVTPFEWVISFDPKAMDVIDISASELASAFKDYFRNDVIGLTRHPQEDGDQRSIVLKLRNQAKLDFDQIPIVQRNGRIYYLRDFASVSWCESLPSSYFRINGLNTVSLTIACKAQTNMLTVASSVKQEMARLQRSFPAELSATLTHDASEYVSSELNKIYFRTLFCVAILLLFVYFVSRHWRYLFIIMVTLIVNILVAVVFYYLLDLNIHIYTLAGITVSLGIIIDTSIIMVDHYSYYRNRRVFVSILGALLTTVGALSIVWLLPEQQRTYLADFSLVIVINLIVSLLIALLFIPSLLDMFPLGRCMTFSSISQRRQIARFSDLYGSFIIWGRGHRWIFIVALIWGFGIPTYLLPNKIEKSDQTEITWWGKRYNDVMTSRLIVEYRSVIDKTLGGSFNLFRLSSNSYNNFRVPEQKRLYIRAGMVEGCTVQQLNEVVGYMENYISQFDEVEMFSVHISSYNSAQIEITFKPGFEIGAFPLKLKRELTSAAINYGGATWRVWGIDDNTFNNNVIISSRPNRIRLQGYNFDQLSLYAQRLIDSLSQNRRVSETEIMDGDGWALPHNEFNVCYNKEKIAAAELDVTNYYQILSTMLYRSQLTSVYNGNTMQRVVIESADRDLFDRWHIANAQVRLDSVYTKLSEIGTIEKQRTGASVHRNQQSYAIQVGFDFNGPYGLGTRYIERVIRQFNDKILPVGFKAYAPSHYIGWAEKSRQIWLILVVIAIIYAMCVIIFESWLKPFAIILMIPISFIGVFLTFGWSGFIFDQGGFAALVLLCGIVVNAGIYLINEENNLVQVTSQRGIALYLKAYNHKIVPIALTIASTVLGLLPFLYDGHGEVFWFAFAVAAIGGALFSILALFVYLPIFMPMRNNSDNQ